LASKSLLAVPGCLAVTNEKDGSHNSNPGIGKQPQTSQVTSRSLYFSVSSAAAIRKIL
jgi:hypothetical protein